MASHRIPLINQNGLSSSDADGGTLGGTGERLAEGGDGRSYQSFADLENSVGVVFPPPADTSSGGWRCYTQDLDFFFKKVYHYHQRSGFAVYATTKLIELAQFIFVVTFTEILINCIDYQVLFKKKLPASSQPPLPSPTPTPGPAPSPSAPIKVTLADVILPFSSVSLSNLEIFLLIFASFFWLFKLAKVIHSLQVSWAIKQFYADVLHIKDCSKYSWSEIESILVGQQHAYLMETDQELGAEEVLNRILRHENYLIAMINRRLIPIHYTLPLIDYDVVYFTKILLFNLKLLIFSGPICVIFDKSWQLAEEVKHEASRQLAADRFAQRCVWLAVINFLLSPLVSLWQLLNVFYTYVEQIKRDPLFFGSRGWSLYARYYCRNFNELDHCLAERLNHAYKPATKYMNSFTSPLAEVVAKHVSFMAGAILAVLLCLTVYDEDVITVEHVITLITLLGGLVALSRAFISPDVPLKYSQAELHAQVMERIHYTPYPDKTPASAQARDAMAMLFQYRVVGLLEELLSPLLVPLILYFSLSARSLQMVDFFRSNTVVRHSRHVEVCEDVCKFAVMKNITGLEGREGVANPAAVPSPGASVPLLIHREPNDQFDFHPDTFSD